MPAEIPYMTSVTNVPAILDRIQAAGTPPRFTHDFLKSSLGFGSSNDRAIVKILRHLGLLTTDGTPTPRYNEFKGQDSGLVIAQGLREGWADLFMSDEKVYKKTNAEIVGIVKSVTGSSDSVAQKIASTFKAFADKAVWTTPQKKTPAPTEDETPPTPPESSPSTVQGPDSNGLLQLHHDIHLHLPPTSDVGVYRAIFQAMKSELI